MQVLVKMLNSGLFSELNGCVSTGKEANVYQAATEDGKDLAVKIYKTSILTFKDRDRSAACKARPLKWHENGTLYECRTVTSSNVSFSIPLQPLRMLLTVPFKLT